MTEVDRDIGLVLLKRLWKQNLITEAVYVAACNSKYSTERILLRWQSLLRLKLRKAMKPLMTQSSKNVNRN